MNGAIEAPPIRNFAFRKPDQYLALCPERKFMKRISIRRMAVTLVSILTVNLFLGLAPAQIWSQPLYTESSAETLTLPAATAGVEYEYSFQSTGGLAPLFWRVAQGELPSGLSLEPRGKLRGIAARAQRESYSFVIEVSDSSTPPQKFSQPFLMFVRAAPLRIVMNAPPLKIVPPSENPVKENLTATSLSPPQRINGDNPSVDTVNQSLSGEERVTAGNGASSAIRASAGAASNSSITPALSSAPAAQATIVKICGKLRPASLDQVLALISNVPDLRTSSLMMKIEDGRLLKDDTCEENSGYVTGTQKNATVELLEFVDAALSNGNLSRFASVSNANTIAEAIRREQRERFPQLSLDTVRKQIDLLNSYLGDVTVQIKKNGTVVATPQADKDGNYIATVPKDATTTLAAPMEYSVSTEGDNYQTERSFMVGEDAPQGIRIDIPIEDRPVSLLTRAVVGYQQSGAASSDSEQNYFFDLFVRSSFPFKQKINPDFGERFQIWSAIRVASIPQAGTASIGDTINGGFVSGVSGLKLSEAARVFDFLGGVEIRLKGNNSLLPSFAGDTKQKFSLSFIGSYGFTTPTTPRESLRRFDISDELRALLPAETAGKTVVAFVNNDRDRFFNQLYAGFRIQTFFFNRFNVPIQRFPAQFDAQFGLNSYVTGGRLNQGVIRLDGYFPLPYDRLKFINLYGTAILRPAAPRITSPLVLNENTDSSVTVPGPNVAIIPVSQFNRDYYKVGVGIDFMSFIQMITKR